MRRMLIASIALLGMLSVTADAATWYVRQDGSGDAVTIQGGMYYANSGDVVVVGPGTYTGSGNYNITMDGKNLTLVSEAGPLATVIDCQSMGQAFLFTSGETSDAVVEGFTIKNGNATHGGAIYCDGASPTIRFNVFLDNLAWGTGGAIHSRQGSPQIYNNTFHGNGAQAGGAVMLGPQSNVAFYQNLVCGSTSGGAFACLNPGGLTLTSCNDSYGNVGGDYICAGSGSNNFNSDPLFCGIPGSGNYFLMSTSPCTPNFSPCAGLIGALGILCQVTKTENATWGRVKSLYR